MINSGTGTIAVTFPDLAIGSYTYRIFHAERGYMLREGIYIVNESTPVKQFQILVDGAVIEWDITEGYNAVVTLGGNRTLTLTGAEDGDCGTIVVKQDDVGGRTLSRTGIDNGLITLSTAANAIDILAFLYDGTDYYWNFGKGYE
jgi:hypothetical protein